jgi:membrane fusion protein (multidrug efflux system)
VKKTTRITLLALVLIIAAAAGTTYRMHAGKFRSTENAYLNADIVQVASQVSGPVIAVNVHEGELVKAGQSLFDISPTSYQLALEQAEARLAQAEQDNNQDRSDVLASIATVHQAEVSVAAARVNADRIRDVLKKHYTSQQDDDTAQVQLREAEAALEETRAKLASAEAKVQARGKATPAVLSARAAVDQARNDLANTHVVASKDGWIANLTLVRGTSVVSSVPLFSLVARGSFWVDANFKETELPGIVAGQKADITVDMQPGHRFQGEVAGIGYGTGAAFSLLPAQNATGNWVKVTQRVPVRIRFTGDDALQAFRVGASANVTVHLKGV